MFLFAKPTAYTGKRKSTQRISFLLSPGVGLAKQKISFALWVRFWRPNGRFPYQGSFWARGPALTVLFLVPRVVLFLLGSHFASLPSSLTEHDGRWCERLQHLASALQPSGASLENWLAEEAAIHRQELAAEVFRAEGETPALLQGRGRPEAPGREGSGSWCLFMLLGWRKG